jgi:hypothetical protein
LEKNQIVIVVLNMCNQKRREPRRQSDSSRHCPSMSTSGLSYKPARVHTHTHTTQRPNTGALLAELRDRIASQHEPSTHSAKRVHSHKTTKTESNTIPHSKSNMYIFLRQHKHPHPLCCSQNLSVLWNYLSILKTEAWF